MPATDTTMLPVFPPVMHFVSASVLVLRRLADLSYKVSYSGMNKIRKLLLSSGFLLLPSLAHAAPITEFVDTLFIGGGVMLFIAGVLLLLIPGLFKTGVVITLLADILFMTRVLFPDVLEQDLAADPDWQLLVESTTTGSSRFYAAMGVAFIVLSILGLRWLVRSFFAPPGTGKPKANNKLSRQTSARPARFSNQKQPTRNKTRLNRDREDFSGYTEEPELQPEPVSPVHNKRFRVHDYLENLEHQQAQPEPQPVPQDIEPAIHFDRIER